jgi:hypothetical protein
MNYLSQKKVNINLEFASFEESFKYLNILSIPG